MIVTRYCQLVLALPLTGELILPAARLDALLSLDAQQKTAQQRALAHLQQAREQRHLRRARDRRYLAHRLRRQQQCAQKLYQRATAQGRKAALQWLIDEHQWERQVTQRLMQQLTDQLATHLKQQLPGLAWELILHQQLPVLLEKMASDQPLTLRLPGALLARAGDLLSAFPVALAALPADVEGEAWLENDTTRITVPLENQLKGLMQQLAALTWPENVYGRD
ncbi:hypothetical protein IB231_22125 [Pantoea sp. PNT02]|uniref:hypothetical protein n=1 Tax=Pantoea sp. PNT02 TaxID=2769261 RepID=UPI001783831E|nr:hypothetical protein [Pantoea sp. PNT02]MBD9646322.1 hypothetical protein [Pantoea sp. PNT02]